MVNDGQEGYVDGFNQFRIHGTISNFNATSVSYGSSMPDLSGWRLSLNSASIGARETSGLPNYNSDNLTPANVFPTSVDGTTTGGGKWQGEFYGGANTGLKDGASVPKGLTATRIGVAGEAPNQTLTAAGAKFDDYPTAIVGEFNGHFSNGHVASAFGADKE